MEWNILLGAVLGVMGFALSYVAFFRGKTKDDRADGQQSGVIFSELGYIKSNTDDIKNEQKEQRKINTDLYIKLSAVEASTKQAHKRLDRMEGKLDHEGQ